MFLDNKYTKWYFNIINNRKTTAVDGYHEKHHILPKCMGGLDDDSNIASLTAKEHFICHLLLTKMVVEQYKHKLAYAFSCMVHGRHTSNRHITTNSRSYDYAKQLCSNAMKNRWSDPQFRLIASERQRIRWTDPEYRQQMSEQSKRLWDDQETRRARSEQVTEFWSDPNNRKVASARMKERCKDPEFQKLKTFSGDQNGMWGKTHTDEVKQKLSRLAKERYTGISYEERHGTEKAAELRKQRSNDMKRIRKDRSGVGSANPNHKTDVFTFTHISGVTFTGTRQEFHETRNIRRSDISLLISGRQKTAKGWKLLHPN